MGFPGAVLAAGKWEGCEDVGSHVCILPVLQSTKYRTILIRDFSKTNNTTV